MKISLKEKLVAVSTLSIDFTNMTVTKAVDGSNVVILKVDPETPINYVRGSQDLDTPGGKVALEAYDVQEVKVHENDMIDGLEWDDETDTGSYKGSDLVLDVAKRTGDVWLRQTSFAQSGSEMRNTARNNGLNTIINKMKAAKEANKEPNLVP